MKSLALLAAAALGCVGCSETRARNPAPGRVEWIWSGATTDASAEVRAKIPGAFQSALITAEPDAGEPVRSAAVAPLAPGQSQVYAFPLAGLKPNTLYRYQVVVDGRADTASAGRFRTMPAGPSTFRFAFASCARTGSVHPVFGRILSLDPLFFLHTGDIHYENVSSPGPEGYRRALDRVLTSPVQRDFFRALPVVYMWDDHDFGGDNCDSTNPGRAAARQTYREYAPHYPLAGPGTIQQAFTVGRVRFLVTDGRSGRSPRNAPDGESKTVLGKDQKEWFKSEVRAAKGLYPLVVWVNTMPWISAAGKDDWSRYAAERRELAGFIREQGIALCMLSGDAHMLAIDDGAHSDFSGGPGPGFPVFHAAPLDRPGSEKGGPYTGGVSAKRGQFGLMSVTDDGGDRLEVEWQGMNHRGETVMRHAFWVSAAGGNAPGRKP